MAAWRCVLRRISDVPAATFRSPSAGWRQRSWAAWTTARSVSSDGTGSGPDLQPDLKKPNRRRRPAAKPATAKRHLYVAVEDQEENGFAIHKLDIDDVHSGSTEPPPLPPPVVRLAVGTPMESKATRFAALGSSIVAMGTRRVENSTSIGGVTVVYDTDTAALTKSDLLPTDLFYGHDAAVAAGNRLYLLEQYSTPFHYKRRCNRSKYHGALHYLKTADPKDDDARRDRSNERWRWQPFPESSGLCWSSNTSHLALPFDPESITAHAVHPRGRTILVSASREWMLPFRGPACYDPHLDAWVGLYLDPHDKDAHRESAAAREVDYHLCASRVTSARRGEPPEWKKVSIEELSVFSSSHDRHWREWDVKVQLLYMRERGEYCLVEYLALDKHVLRLSVFRLSYGDEGELVVTARLPARSYEMPTYYEECFHDDDFGSQAFWM